MNFGLVTQAVIRGVVPFLTTIRDNPSPDWDETCVTNVTSVTCNVMDLNIRDFPQDVLKKLKMRAAADDKPMREVVIAVLSAATKVAEGALRQTNKTAAGAGRRTGKGRTGPRSPKVLRDGAVVARLAHNQEVAGAIPAPATNSLTDQTTMPRGASETRIPTHGPNTGERNAHDKKTCRLYGCMQCKADGVKDAKRGLA